MIYEFICKKCGLSKTVHRSVKDRNNPCYCDRCNPQQKMERQIGCPGFVFKGTGFYTTDVLHKKTLRKQVLKEKKHRETGGL